MEGVMQFTCRVLDYPISKSPTAKYRLPQKVPCSVLTSGSPVFFTLAIKIISGCLISVLVLKKKANGWRINGHSFCNALSNVP